VFSTGTRAAAGPISGRPRCASRRRSEHSGLLPNIGAGEYDVDVSPDGRSALERMRMHPYDCHCDLKMPHGPSCDSRSEAYKAICRDHHHRLFNRIQPIEAVNLGVAGY